MPVVNYEKYCEMLDNAKKNKFAYPAINITSMSTVNAVLDALQEAKSDGIIQVSSGGGQFASGLALNDMAIGAEALAEYTHFIAEKYDINVALHTDHCSAGKLDGFIKPLLAASKARVEKGMKPLFNSHMFDGSDLPLTENMDISVELLKECKELGIILDVEARVVGGEEDGVSNEDTPAEKLYTTPEDMLYVYERLSAVEGGRYMFAATFGNVHGVYKPGSVKLTPTILKEGQAAVTGKHGDAASFDLVFHGGSGSSIEEIHETLEYGVIKMNIDTDTQYAFTRPIVEHMFKNYDGVLKVDGDVGNKKVYDPRGYLKAAQKGMKGRVIRGCDDLKSTGTTLGV